jgi:hypothetical protein
MDVFLVPVGRDRHELYCEIPPDESDGDDGPPSGWLRRQVEQFREMLKEAEEERVRRERGMTSGTRGPWRWVVGKLAETVAEQRLLWNIRRADSVRLRHPADRDGAAALALARAQLAADWRKHRRWLVIDASITGVTGPLFFFIPGPNVISWYFAFRAVGHFYAMRGAAHGLSRVRWDVEASDDLSAVRLALGLDAPARRKRLDEIAEALGLATLPGFVERVARRPS